MNASRLKTIYRLLLRLFPQKFRDLFGEEMLQTFADRLEEDRKHGQTAYLRTALHELASLPGAALRQCFAAGGQEEDDPDRAGGWDGPPADHEVLLVGALFLLPALGIYCASPSRAPGQAAGSLIAALFIGALVAGLVKGFPRWSLPYLGLALSGICFTSIFQLGSDMLSPAAMQRFGITPQDDSARLLVQSLWAGLMWLGLFCATGLLLGLLALFKNFRSLAARVRNDWSLVSFIFYGGALAALTLSFAQQHEERNFAFSSMAALMCGAVLYLRSPGYLQRCAALLGGLTLAILFASAGHWPLAPVQSGPAWESWWGGQVETPPAIQGALVDWAWLFIITLAPLFLQRISGHSRRQTC